MTDPTNRIELHNFTLRTPSGRVLIEDLHLAIGDEQVALVGRNGSGKSRFLKFLSGYPAQGMVATVPQGLDPQDDVRVKASLRSDTRARMQLQELGLSGRLLGKRGSGLSPGERRKLQLVWAMTRDPSVLLLDEPTADLDERGRAWLFARLAERGQRTTIVATHDRDLLARFRHFFILRESGCDYFEGSQDGLEAKLQEERERTQEHHRRRLQFLAREEARNLKICQRRTRKKNVGRVREIDRATPRSRLNKKRGYAQESQARVAGIREQRIVATREWAEASRRALASELPLQVNGLVGPVRAESTVVKGVGLRACRGGRLLFEKLEVEIGTSRLGIVGPNGAGKSTLLELLAGERRPDSGSLLGDLSALLLLDQSCERFRVPESLLECLWQSGGVKSMEEAAKAVAAHRFPIALAARGMDSLSPGERFRAALVCLAQRRARPTTLLLDEVTAGLDLYGVLALEEALLRWPGGLVVVSHDPRFLRRIGVRRRIELCGEGSWRERVV